LIFFIIGTNKNNIYIQSVKQIYNMEYGG